VVGLAIIPLSVEPSHLSWLRWEIAIGVLGGVGLIAIIAQAVMQSKEDHERDERDKKRDEKQAQIELKVTEVWNVMLKGKPENVTHPTTLIAPQDSVSETKQQDEIDAEVYRVVLTGKGMGAEMARELFKIVGREKEFAIDVDILVEMYVVNSTDSKRFIRDVEGTVEVDGKILPLVRQDDFAAWEFSGRRYEYCLDRNQTNNKFDRSWLEPLLPLFGSKLIGLEARQPLEGWIHYIVKEVDPQKLNDNRTYKFTIIDSLGKEHTILKANMTKRPGEVTVRATKAA
jgi:hypothetical protein